MELPRTSCKDLEAAMVEIAGKNEGFMRGGGVTIVPGAKCENRGEKRTGCECVDGARVALCALVLSGSALDWWVVMGWWELGCLPLAMCIKGQRGYQ